jgi:hypothetical protein
MTISDSAVATRNQIASRVAMSAKPSQSAASAQTSVMMISLVISLWFLVRGFDGKLGGVRRIGVEDAELHRNFHIRALGFFPS